jgi:glycosyltransferase involved in cell wall biosynthesis
MAKRILVIGHDAYRSGAQISLLHILRWLKGNYPAKFSLLLKDAGGGELLGEYAELLPTKVITPSQLASIGRPTRRVSPVRRLARRILKPDREKKAVELDGIDLIYANSAVSADLAAALRAAGNGPVICHIHELEMSIRWYMGVERFRQAQQQIDGYIAASRAAAQNLIANHGIQPERIDVVYEAICIPEHGGREPAELLTKTREELGIPPDAFIVGGCGVMEWRKSPDLFLQIAHRLARSAPPRPVHFIWVGPEGRGLGLDALMYDVDRMGLREIAHFVGPQKHPMKFFSLFDVFLLTSREDPFPLVCLEAAAMEVPTICFETSGGMPEFVEEDAGFVVPYLDIERAADCILSLVNSDGLRAGLGRRAAEKVKAHDINVVGPMIAAVLDRYLR